MALRPLNSVGGFSVGEIPQTIIDGNGNVTANFATFSGNVLISNSNASWGVLTDNLYYSNGQPWDLQEAAGSNTQIQFNNNNDFGASANFTFDTSTNTLTVLGNANLTTVNTTNVASTGNLFLTANGYTLSLYANGLAEFDDGILTTGNLTVGNANLGNFVTANYVNVANDINVVGNVDANNISITNELDANTANFAGNVVLSGATVTIDNELDANTANFSGNVTLSGATVTVTNDLAANTANFSGNAAFSGAEVVVDNELSGNTANFTGNVTAAYFIGNIEGNLTITAPNTSIIYSANGAAVGSNNFTWDYASNVLTANGTANITGNTSVGGILTDNYYYANGSPVDFQQAAGSNTQIQYNNNDDFGASANFTWDSATNTLAVLGNANITTVNTSNVVGGGTDVTINANGYVSTFYGANGLVTLPSALTANGNLTVVNASLGNLATANYINVSSNLVTNNLTVNLELSGNTANFTGNIAALNADLGNLATANYVNVAQQINGNVANFSGNLTSLNADLGNLATANYVNVANDLNVIGNVNAGNLVGPLANGTSNIRIFQDANIEFSSNSISNIVTISDTGLFTSGNIHSTAGYIIANGNVTANGFLVGANLEVTGEANVGSLLTSNITSTGNLTISAGGTNENIILVPTGTGAVDVSGKKIIDLADPTNPTDAATKEYVDAMAGEGLDIHTPVRLESPTALNATYAQGGTTQTTTTISGGNTITFSANHGLSVNDGIVWTNSFNGIVGGEAYWVQSVPALNQITIRDGYFGPEVTTLTNGTGLSQASRANPGVGATLTNAGANAALQIDGVATANNDRILVYTQSNAYENGVYVVSDTGNATAAWVLTRSTDFDKYLPDSPNGLSKGSYVFVTSGLTGAGESYVMTSPTGEVIIGTDNITFTQFSAAGSYTAGNGIDITGTTISANVDNDTTAIVSGNIVVKAGANLTTPNLGDATFSSLSWNTLSNGNVTANNLSIGNIANITLDLTVGGNIQANGTISSNANVSGLNLTTSGNVHASGNVLANNVSANTLLTVPTANVSNIVNAGNVTITNELSGNTANLSGNIIVNNATVNVELSGNTANFSSNVVVNNLTTNLELAGNTANFSGNVILPNLTVNLELAGNTANFTGNVVAANFETAGLANVGNLNVTANVTSDLLPNANVTHDLGSSSQRWDNVYAGNLDLSGNISASGNLSANNFSANTFIANTAVEIGNTVIFAGEVTTTSITANQTISSVPVSGVTGVEWLVKGYDSSGAKYSMAMITAVTDGANADFSTFGTVNLGATTGTLSVNVVGGNIALQVTPSSSNSTVWVTQYRTL